MKQKPKVVFSCFFCEKRIEDAEKLALDEEGNCITSQSKQLTDEDSHFICPVCWTKVKKFCDIKEEK